MREMVKAETLSNRIATIRKSKGMTLETIAEKMGMTRQAVWKMEKNPLGMQMKNMMAMADAMQCDIRDFFTE